MTRTVVILGKGRLATRVADWFLENPDYDLAYVVPNIPPSAWTESLADWAQAANVAVVTSGRAADVPLHRMDLAVSVTYDKILREDFISRCEKAINIHNGPLPRYRGVNPINWALKNGESEHGVTIHDITLGIDTGPILATCRFPINPEVDEVIDVYERSIHFGWKLFKEFIPNVWNTVGLPQDSSRAEYYSAKDFQSLGDRRFFTRRESRVQASGSLD